MCALSGRRTSLTLGRSCSTLTAKMRTIKYRIRYGAGENSSPWKNEPLEKFILEVVTARHVEGFVIPPLHFINEILMSGETSIGMGFQWKPFKLDSDEYQELGEILFTDPKLNVTIDNEFDNAKTLRKWRMEVGKKYRK